MAPDPKILLLEQSRNEAKKRIESGIIQPKDGESKTRAINRVSEEIFFKNLQENSANRTPTTSSDDQLDDSISPHRSLPTILLLLISLPISIFISFNAGLNEISQFTMIIPCLFGIFFFSKTPYFLFAILSLSFLSYMVGSVIYDAIVSLSLIQFFTTG